MFSLYKLLSEEKPDVNDMAWNIHGLRWPQMRVSPRGRPGPVNDPGWLLLKFAILFIIGIERMQEARSLVWVL